MKKEFEALQKIRQEEISNKEAELCECNAEIKKKKLRLQAGVGNSSRQEDLVPECPVCLERMVAPIRIFQCRNSHLICEKCHARVKVCTFCRKGFNYESRAIAVEQIIRSILEN